MHIASMGWSIYFNFPSSTKVKNIHFLNFISLSTLKITSTGGGAWLYREQVGQFPTITLTCCT